MGRTKTKMDRLNIKKTFTEIILDGFLAPSGVYSTKFLVQGSMNSTSLSSYTQEMKSGFRKTVKHMYPEDLHSKLCIYSESTRIILFKISFYTL